jgi:hypothetical protein
MSPRTSPPPEGSGERVKIKLLLWAHKAEARRLNLSPSCQTQRRRRLQRPRHRPALPHCLLLVPPRPQGLHLVQLPVLVPVPAWGQVALGPASAS